MPRRLTMLILAVSFSGVIVSSPGSASEDSPRPPLASESAPAVTLQQLSLPENYRSTEPATKPPAPVPTPPAKEEPARKPLVESEFHGSFTTVFGVSRGVP